MLEKIKNIFYDDQNGIKWLPAIGTIAGAIAGANLEILEPLGMGAIPAGALAGAALGAGADYIKDNVMGAGTAAQTAAHGAAPEKAHGQGHGMAHGAGSPEVPKGIPGPTGQHGHGK